MHRLTTNSQCFVKCNKHSILVKGITRSDTVAMLGWLLCYKNDSDSWIAGLPAFQRKIIGSGKQNYRFFFAEVFVRLADILNLTSISQNTDEFKFTKPWRGTLDVRAIRSITAPNWDSWPNIYAYILIFIALKALKISLPLHLFVSFFKFNTCLYFCFLGSREKAFGLIWNRGSKNSRNTALSLVSSHPSKRYVPYYIQAF